MDISSTRPQATLYQQQQTAKPAAELSEQQQNFKKAAESVESFFLYQMLELSQPKQDPNSPFNGGYGEQVFRSTMNEITAEKMSETGTVGIADSIYAQLIKQQESAQ